MDKSIATYQKATGRNVKVSIDGEYSLPSEMYVLYTVNK